MNVVLFGSTGSANVALQRLLSAPYTLSAVFTRAEAGPCPHYACQNLAEMARAAGVPVFEEVFPGESVAADEAFNARPIDVLASVGYHRKIPQEVYARVPHAVNVHPSLLPEYRGSATANWSIINRERFIGATVHELAPVIDTGSILMQREIAIAPGETAGALRERLAVLMGDLLMAYLDEVNAGRTICAVPQDLSKGTRYPGIGSADGRLEPSATIEEVDARFRGVQPWPGAWIQLSEGRFSVLELQTSAEMPAGMAAGTTIARNGDEVKLAAANGILRLKLRKIG